MTDRKCPFPHDSLPEGDVEWCPEGWAIVVSTSPQSWARKQVRELLSPLLAEYESLPMRTTPPYSPELIAIVERLVEQVIAKARDADTHWRTVPELQASYIDELQADYRDACTDLHHSARIIKSELWGYQKLLHRGKNGTNLFDWLVHAVNMTHNLLPSTPLEKHLWDNYRGRLLWVCQWLAYFPLPVEGFALEPKKHGNIFPLLQNVCNGQEVMPLENEWRNYFSAFISRVQMDGMSEAILTRHGCPALRSRALVKIVDAICDDYESITYGPLA